MLLIWMKMFLFLDLINKNVEWIFFNPLSPSIHIQILQTDLHTFPWRISRENLMIDQGIFSWVIILLILITYLLTMYGYC